MTAGTYNLMKMIVNITSAVTVFTKLIVIVLVKIEWDGVPGVGCL